jgi:hypothetical protein
VPRPNLDPKFHRAIPNVASTAPPGQVPSFDVPTKRRNRRLTPLLFLIVLGLGAGVYVAVKHVPAVLGETGCTAGSGRSAVALDPEQAQIAATIAGVAHQRDMPARAVTVAYAAALQESHLHNLDYGDRDSVGVFQQRPSEGWGPASKLIDPVYATTKFFLALARVHGYRKMPVYKAAQAVQHSADGLAYQQYQSVAEKLTTAFTGASPRAVWCWPPGSAANTTNFSAAQEALVHTFGRLTARRASAPGDAPALQVRAAHPDVGWSVAAWLVTHAGQFQLRDVSYAGFQWRASSGGSGWTKDTTARVSAVQAT